MKQGKVGIFITILVNIFLPYLIYTLLEPHMSSVSALIIAACVPLLDSVYSLITIKKVDAFSGFIFLGLVLGIIAAVIGGDERFILLRESYITAILGGVFLVSLISSKPIIYHFAMRFSPNKDMIAKRWEENEGFRKSFRLMSFVWGSGMILITIIQVILVYTISIPAFLIASQIVQYGIMGIMIFWNVRYVNQMKKQSKMIHGM
ncbi:hypothetical protein MK805_01110 [Shimazuella sp. AN120528]|uniref:VC0807 family protein n=1 Tax=Shimazuella soli TaxID=1892854 RepID=UPI001F0F4489|nr:VC0807 family protein [Shimazuella soli]MCH5583569.1 hypothetical protein [Shimazuella soli]